MALANWTLIKLAIDHGIFTFPFISQLLCLATGTQDTAQEMLPVYPWWASNEQQALEGPVEVLQQSSVHKPDSGLPEFNWTPSVCEILRDRCQW